MSIMQRLVAAARRGSLWSSARWRLLILHGILREIHQRIALKVRFPRRGALPAITCSGDFAAGPEGKALMSCFAAARDTPSGLPDQIRAIEGMSGQRYRSFINRLVGAVPDPAYLEVGSWAGSTAAAALFGNGARALCIDNWSLFGGPRSQFFENIELALSERTDFRFLEEDFRKVDFGSIGRFNIYLFDGPHEEADQYDGLMLAQPALTPVFFLVVDDWNWRASRLGTFRALLDARCRIECAIEIRTTLDDSHPLNARTNSDWHNGYFLAVIAKT